MPMRWIVLMVLGALLGVAGEFVIERVAALL
jgi:hypothetical protein